MLGRVSIVIVVSREFIVMIVVMVGSVSLYWNNRLFIIGVSVVLLWLMLMMKLVLFVCSVVG